MTSISNFLAPDHQRCDELFAQAEASAADADWAGAATNFDRFREALMHHFAMEEEVMFPAFEESTGMLHGPTEMMRSEHRQMTELVNQMGDAAIRKDADGFLGDAETLLIIMQQHNMKEEQMLYRMADQVLAGESENLVERMRAIG